ncbi:unnamed protein product [Ceratitis capitata]|uniref:(Mediterranean fruit fly) hypothetical protein n=1 Tax=Ceratitis capitata TaxID=7213 RepID=A0A811UD11_CERCA|nr:unnamed protein product [Ceratitis capitata]
MPWLDQYLHLESEQLKELRFDWCDNSTVTASKDDDDGDGDDYDDGKSRSDKNNKDNSSNTNNNLTGS